MGKDLKGKELGKGISQRKSDGQYIGRFTNKLGKRQVIYNRNLKQLKVDLKQAIYEDENSLSLIDSTIKLDDWYVKWMDIHKYNLIRENTRRHYNNIYYKHISPVLGNYRISEITQLQIKSLIKSLDEKGLKYETQNKTRIMLLDMFNKAMIDNFVRMNPAKGISVKRNEEVERRVLTVEEQKVFFDCCKGTFYENLFVVAITTGLRMGELAALRECDLDFESKIINVTRTIVYQKLDGDTKKDFILVHRKRRQVLEKFQ